jgi:hypothetical protein
MTTKPQTLSEHYTDKVDFVTMTRTRVVEYAQLASIAGHLCRNAEDLAASTNPPCVESCRIAGAMLGWALNLVPMRIGTRFDY